VPLHYSQYGEYHGPYDTEVGRAIENGFDHAMPVAVSLVGNVYAVSPDWGMIARFLPGLSYTDAELAWVQCRAILEHQLPGVKPR
jgi:hypothetical protein